jgi:5-methyltetrahydrofolate--homocysteine methyltransferase
MLIKRPADIRSSEITDEKLYWNRREFIRGAGLAAGAAAGAGVFWAADATLSAAEPAPHGRKLENVKPSELSETKEKANSWEQITTYNNYYEFGLDKDDPAAKAAVMEVVDIPLCFDSANPNALAAALEVYKGKALINSTTAEEKMMDTVFPIAKQYGAAVIGVITDDKGVPASPADRLRVAAQLLKRAGDYGIRPEDIIIDPLALTVSADHCAGRVTLDSIRLIRQELGVNMNLGASNVSFGLPDRKIVNVAYLALAIANGLTTAITDPTVSEIQTTLLACDLLMGRDEFSMSWIKAFRKREKAKAAAA